MPLFRLKCFPGLRSKTRSTKLHENRDPRNYTKWERLTRSYSFGYWFSLPWERGRLARIPREIDQIAGETPALPGQTEPVSSFVDLLRSQTRSAILLPLVSQSSSFFCPIANRC